MSAQRSSTHADAEQGANYHDPVPSLAQRYVVSEQSVRRLQDLMSDSCGRECIFDIEELGGQGHWRPGGVSGPAGNDYDRRVRIDGLCCELAALLRGMETASPQALTHCGLGPMSAGESWWPAWLGAPASSGEHQGIRFAFFPHVRRLMVQQGARIDAYDTGDYILTGLAHDQGQVSSVTFDSNRGPVHLDQLRCVPVA